MTKDKKPYTILVIEDNLGDFTIVEEFLLEQILIPTIFRAINFKETEHIIANNNINFDVVLLDLSLPDKSEVNLVISITKLITNCPIIILTGFTDIDFSIKSISLGIADYLLKDDLTATMLYKSIIYTIQRKKAINELKESEKRYSNLFHASPLPMWVYDIETLRFVQVNNAAIKHYGYTETEFLNMTILDIRPDDEIEKVIEIFEDKSRHITGIFKGNFKHQKKSGELIDVEISSTPLIISNKQFISVIANDITEKNRYEQKITKAIIKTQEDERYEVGTELHDNVCQILATSKIRFKMLEKLLPETELPKFIDGIKYMDLAFKEIRNLSHRLAPSFLSDTSIADACKTLFSSLNIDHECTLVLCIDDDFKALKTSK
ncbi:MAG: PAS domain S-box protein, partial [Deinococcales bacterium]|nr:PAS domain S-box protein [Chitinophagaceae bacterium]